MIHSEMTGILDRPQRRIEKTWDAGELGQAALAYADTLHNLARYLTGYDTDADDLVQETYARALQAAGQFTPGTNLKAWRRERNNPVVGGFDITEPAVGVAAEDHWFMDDAELDRLRKVVAAEIEAALMTLSEDARTVILLDLEGLTEGEVAEVIGCPLGTVKSRLARARAALRLRLKDYAR